MKKYLIAIIVLLITVSVNPLEALFSPECDVKIKSIMETLPEFKEKSLQQMIEDGTFNDFKTKTGIDAGGR